MCRFFDDEDVQVYECNINCDLFYDLPIRDQIYASSVLRVAQKNGNVELV